MKEEINEIIDKIIINAHHRWINSLELFKSIVSTYERAYEVLTPYAFSYLEFLIRYITSEIGKDVSNQNIVGKSLINLAIKENANNIELCNLLEEIKNKHYCHSDFFDCGSNRNSSNHGLIAPERYTFENFYFLLSDIARLSETL